MSSPSDFAAQFVELFRISTRLAQEVAEGMGITRTQIGALFRIGELKRLTMSDLKRDLDVTTGAITGLIDRLEDQGLVRRVPSQDDRRVVFLELTPAGHDMNAAIRAAWDRKLTAWIDRLPEHMRGQVSELIGALVAVDEP